MPQHVRRQSGCETVAMTPRSLRLSPRQQEALAQLQGKLTPATPPATDDEVTLAGLDAWIAGVLSSQGQVAAKSVRYLLEQQVEATPGSAASTMVDAVVAVVLPVRGVDDDWPNGQAAVVIDHCSSNNYRVDQQGPEEFGWVRWSIDCATDGTKPARLSTDGEVVELSFPGGYTWAEYGYNADDSAVALTQQLRLLSAYAATSSQDVLARRWLGRQRRELHLSDGTRLWRGGGSRPYPPI